MDPGICFAIKRRKNTQPVSSACFIRTINCKTFIIRHIAFQLTRIIWSHVQIYSICIARLMTDGCKTVPIQNRYRELRGAWTIFCSVLHMNKKYFFD